MLGATVFGESPISDTAQGLTCPDRPIINEVVANSGGASIKLSVLNFGGGELTEFKIYRSPRPILVYDFNSDGVPSIGNVELLGGSYSGGGLSSGSTAQLYYDHIDIHLDSSFTIIIKKSVTADDYAADDQLFSVEVAVDGGFYQIYLSSQDTAPIIDFYVVGTNSFTQVGGSIGTIGDIYSVTFEDGIATLKIDGVEVASGPIGDGYASYNGISVSNGVGNVIDQVAIYNSALSSDELALVDGREIEDTLFAVINASDVQFSPFGYRLNLSGLVNGEDYRFVVTALNTSGESADSVEFSVTPEPSPIDNSFIEDVIERRLKPSVGGNTTTFVELLGGSMVPTLAFEPDATTHRGEFYYNTSRNILYKKVIVEKRPYLIAHWAIASNR